MAEIAESPQDTDPPTGNSSDAAIDWAAELEKHRGWLEKVLRCRIGNSTAVDDSMQEIALAVVRQTNKPQRLEKVAAWFYRLALRFSINYHRRRGRQQNLLNGFAHFVDQSQGPSRSTDPLDWLVHCEEQEAIRQAINELPVQDREILILKYSENWTYKQLAERLGASTTTVESRLVRAKKRLRQRLVQGLASEALS